MDTRNNLPTGFIDIDMLGPPHVLPASPVLRQGETGPQPITRSRAMVVEDATSATKSAKLSPVVSQNLSTLTDAQIINYLSGVGNWSKHVHSSQWTAAPRTPFDIELSQGGSHAGEGCFVLVWITDPNAWFMANELAITAGNPASANELYDLRIHDFDAQNPGQDPKPRVASFKMQSRLNPRYASYNLGLILEQSDGLRLPTFYDPKIKNDG